MTEHAHNEHHNESNAGDNVARPLIVHTATKFFFKKDKVGNKRPTIELNVPYLTVDGLIHALKDEKQVALILEVVNGEIYKAVRAQVGDEDRPVNSQEELDVSKLTLEFLANQPAAERRGGGISAEVWEEWAKDYIAVMPGASGKDVDKVTNAATIMVKKFQPVKTQKKIIAYLREQLALWLTTSPNAEDFTECYEFLDKKAEALLSADEAALLANL